MIESGPGVRSLLFSQLRDKDMNWDVCYQIFMAGGIRGIIV